MASIDICECPGCGTRHRTPDFVETEFDKDGFERSYFTCCGKEAIEVESDSEEDDETEDDESTTEEEVSSTPLFLLLVSNLSNRL